jgi:glycosyltransferase involved in cell wall biosynthesis
MDRQADIPSLWGRRTVKIVVGIATAGRAEQLSITLSRLAHQTRVPDRVVVCPATRDDYDGTLVPSLLFPVNVVQGRRGLPSQRNLILKACADADVIVFFDDDFYPADDYLQHVETLFTNDGHIAIARGDVVADGATGPGLTHAEALHVLATLNGGPLPSPVVGDIYGAYGCNMSVRMAPVLAYGVRFDENLPLYAWLEDIDFSRRIAPYGRVVKSTLLRGVHLGIKRGRTSGVKLGYSQVANPLYMLRKGSLCRSYALRQMSRNVGRNLLRAMVPEPWVDRRGRLKGNVLGFADLLRGRLDPRKILQLD